MFNTNIELESRTHIIDLLKQLSSADKYSEKKVESNDSYKMYSEEIAAKLMEKIEENFSPDKYLSKEN